MIPPVQTNLILDPLVFDKIVDTIHTVGKRLAEPFPNYLVQYEVGLNGVGELQTIGFKNGRLLGIFNRHGEASQALPARLVLAFAQEQLQMQAVVHAGSLDFVRAVVIEAVAAAKKQRCLHFEIIFYVTRLVVVVAIDQHFLERKSFMFYFCNEINGYNK
jgi:hypothetical protein